MCIEKLLRGNAQLSGPGTSLAFPCIQSECLTQARMGSSGVRGFQMTGT